MATLQVSSFLYASESNAGTLKLATEAEVKAGKNHTKSVTAKTLKALLDETYKTGTQIGTMIDTFMTDTVQPELNKKADKADFTDTNGLNNLLAGKLDKEAKAVDSGKLNGATQDKYAMKANDEVITGSWVYRDSFMFDQEDILDGNGDVTSEGKNNAGVKWRRNQEGATIGFHSTGRGAENGQENSWLMFVTHGDEKEWFQWAVTRNTYEADPNNPEDDTNNAADNKGTYLEWMSLKGGNLQVRGDLTFNFSDERLKDVVEELHGDKCLDAVKKWRPIRYRPNEIGKEYGRMEDKLDVGLIAGDVAEDFPELAPLAPFDTDYVSGESKSGEDYKTLRYERTIAVLTGAIQYLSHRIDQLEANQ